MRFPVVNGVRKRELAHYTNSSQSYAEFRSIWRRLYGGRCPTIKDAKKYSGNDRSETWLKNVYSVYDCRDLEPSV